MFPFGGPQADRLDAKIRSMELGLDAPGAIEKLVEALQIIGITQEAMDRLPSDPAELGKPGTDLNRWVHDELPDPPVDPRLTIMSGLDSSIQCLGQIKRFVEDPGPTTTPMVMAALMRTALLASIRPIFMLGPLSAEERKANVLRVMRQETDSLFRCYNRNATYVELAHLVPPESVLSAQGARRGRILEMTQPLHETTMLTEAAGILADRVAARTGDAEDLSVRRVLIEQLLWIFNAYSGKAHGYGWPRLVAHPDDLPGHFVSDFGLLAGVSQMAVHVTEEAHLGIQP